MKAAYKHISLLIILFLIALISAKASAEEEENSDLINIQEEIAPMPEVKTEEAADLDSAPSAEENLISPAPANSEPEENSAMLEAEAEALAEEDENITAQSLEISEPSLLPDNKVLYPLKNLWRVILTAAAFNPVKKAEIKLKFASEKLLEAKKIAEKTDNPDSLNSALKNYNKEVETVKERVEKIKERAKDSDRIDKFVEKMADRQIKHSILLNRLEKKLPEEMFEKVSENLEKAKEKSLANFTEAALKIADPEKMKEKLENAIENRRGSDFSRFRHLEILKKIEENAPEEAKEAIQKARENTLEKFEEKLSNLEEKRIKIFKRYIKKIGGNDINNLEIINDLENMEISDTVRKNIEEAKKEAVNKIEKLMKDPRLEKERERTLIRLKEGKLENVRLIKEMENNLSPESAEKIIKVKNAAIENFKANLENLNDNQKEKILKKVEKIHDVKQLGIIKEIDQALSEDKKEFWTRVGEKAKEEIKNEIKNASNGQEKKMILEKLSGDGIEQVEAIKELIPEYSKELIQEQTRKIERKAQNIQDAIRLESIKNKMELNKTIKKEILDKNPEIPKKLNKQKEQLGTKVMVE